MRIEGSSERLVYQAKKCAQCGQDLELIEFPIEEKNGEVLKIKAKCEVCESVFTIFYRFEEVFKDGGYE